MLDTSNIYIYIYQLNNQKNAVKQYCIPHKITTINNNKNNNHISRSLYISPLLYLYEKAQHAPSHNGKTI